ncbi:MAG: agmatine deiminase family protein [Bacteroidales bacterium]
MKLPLVNVLPCLLILLFFLPAEIYAQEPEWDDPESLPIWLTPEEKLRLDEIGAKFEETPPPELPVRNIAEFEPMEGVMVRYPLGIPLSLIADISQHATVFTLVESYYESQAVDDYMDAGVNMDNCEFVNASTNSYWTRDYGPWYVALGDQEIGLVDFPYNRPRPDDDAIPGVMADYLDLDIFGMDVEHTGGNYMSDGMGIAASTDLVYTENQHNQEYVNSRMEDYLGIETYHVTMDPTGSYIEHIDTWAKYLDVDKIMIAEVPESHYMHWAYEQLVDYFESQTSAYGTPYEVVRVYTPDNQPYTNSLIINDRVYVPITGSSWDSDALETFEEAMPGYEVLGFQGSWQSTDALHCRVKDMADTEMLYVEHVPIHGEQPYQEAFVVEAELIPYSGEPLYSDSLFAIYKANEGQFDTIPLLHKEDHTYEAAIPVTSGDTLITYYLSAADESGRKETWPYIGAPGARSFEVSAPVSTAEVSFEVEDAHGDPVENASIIFGDTENEPGEYSFHEVAPGTYSYLVSKDCYLPAEGEVTVDDDDMVVPVTLLTLPGDANDDGLVDTDDVLMISGYVLAQNPQPFCFGNADVNQDEVVNILDAIETLHITTEDPVVKGSDKLSETAGLYLHHDGISIDSDGTIAGLQLTITGDLPAQLVSELPDHELMYAMVEGTIRALLFSLDNTPIPEGQLPIISFDEQEELPDWGDVLAGNMEAAEVPTNLYQDDDTGLDKPEEIAFRVFPNPARDYLEVDVSSTNSGRVDIWFSNLHGQLLQSRLHVEAGSRVRLNLEGLTPGFYVLEIKNQTMKEVRKILVQ